MHDRLFMNPALLGRAVLDRHADEVGLDMSAFRNCFASRGLARVMADEAEGIRLGVSATPTFFLGVLAADGQSVTLRREIVGGGTYDIFKSELDAAVARRGPSAS
jgi:predicted DsbA family dithiol-disulfide isomerase